MTPRTDSRDSPPPLSQLSAIFLISFCTLAFEIYLLRLFSIREWYHFASMVVSMALFGLSVSGTALALLPRPNVRSLPILATAGAVGFAITACAAVSLGSHFQFEPLWAAFGRREVATLISWYLLCGAPFVFSGLVVGAYLAALPERAGLIYGASLAGSGAGAVAFLFLLPLLREQTPAVLGGLALAAAIAFAGGTGRLRRVRWVLLPIAAAMPLLHLPPPAISTYKTLSRIRSFKGSEVVSTRWDAASQVDVVRSDQIRSAPGRSLRAAAPLPPQMGILIDGDRLTPVTAAAGEPPEFVGELPSAVAYRLRRGGNALVLQAGGGLSVLSALGAGMVRVTAQEANRLVAEAASRGVAAEMGGRLYDREEVRLIVEDARGYLRRSDEPFDVIEISLREGIFASTTGLSGLGEEFLFTLEAFGRLHDHLRPDGILQVTQWIGLPPREPVKLFATALEAWGSSGEDVPRDCLVAFRSISTFTLLARRGVFRPDELAALREDLEERGYDLVYAPDLEWGEVNRHHVFDRPYFAELIRQRVLTKDPGEFYRAYPIDWRPATDDRPFFRTFLRWGRIRELREEMGMQWQPFFEAEVLYAAVLVIASVLSIVFLILPVAFVHRRRHRPGAPRVASYFFLLGLGFMFVEVPAIQSSILTLGEPAYAFSAVIGSVLIFSGIGSVLSGRVGRRRGPILVLAAGIFLYALLLPVWRDSISGPGPLRLALTALALAPVAVLLGFPFPSAIRSLSRDGADLIPWAWAANGAASVIGAVLATLLATRIGFAAVMAAGAVLYLAAWAILPGADYFSSIAPVIGTKRQVVE